MARCKRTPNVAVYLSDGNPAKITVPPSAAEFTLQCRELVDMTLAYPDASGPSAAWTIKAGTTFTEDLLRLDQDLHLLVTVATANHIELTWWDAA